jgi:hypothetical protein
MELGNLQLVVAGLNSLGDLEKQQHPVLGAQLLTFVKEIRNCCNEAYGRLSDALGFVLKLPAKPSEKQLEDVSTILSDAPNSDWFKNVSGICDRLAALATTFEPQLRRQMDYAVRTTYDPANLPAGQTAASQYQEFVYLEGLLTLLKRHEGELKDDMRHAVGNMLAKLGDARSSGTTAEAKAYAMAIQEEIAASSDAIAKISYQIEGGSSKGAEALLTPEKMAENALRTPERMLILSMFFVILLFALGAFSFRFLQFYQFVLVTGFSLTTVIVVNAFYLRNIGKLSELNFLKLMELALLKFFAPLTRRQGGPDKNAPTGTRLKKRQ